MKVKNRPVGDENNTWIEVYFRILSRYAIQINWIIVLIILTTITGIFAVYNSEFGSLKFAKEREQHLVNTTIDSLLIMEDSLYREKFNGSNDSARIVHIIEDLNSNKLKYDSNLNEIKLLDNETRINKIPILGAKFDVPEYYLILYLICCGAIFWLLTILEFTKNVLKEVFNYPSTGTTGYDISIPSLFYLILPSNDNLKFYKFFELILCVFLFSIILIATLIGIEFWVNHELHGKALVSVDGFRSSQVFWALGIYLILIMIISIFYINVYWRVLDIRNLLILIKWQRTAFFPELYKIFEERNLYLNKDQNRMEYRKVGIANNMELCIYANVFNPSNPEDIRFIHDSVNLARSLRKFMIKNKTEAISRVFKIDKYLNRILTVEEDKMRDFFRSLLIDKEYESNLCNSFENVTHPLKSIQDDGPLVFTYFNQNDLNKVKEYIEKNKLRNAIDVLQNLISEAYPDRSNQLSLLRMRYNRIHSNSIKGIIPADTFELELRILANNILEIVSVLDSPSKGKQIEE